VVVSEGKEVVRNRSERKKERKKELLFKIF
jgi:hypothetical protein